MSVLVVYYASRLNCGAWPVDVPQRADFAFQYLPTPTTLFRFSALTFNAHQIHLDKHYAVDLEGYRGEYQTHDCDHRTCSHSIAVERLVHGPMTALMLLDVTSLHKPAARFKTFTYRALNPLVVNEPIVVKGIWRKDHSVDVWAESAVDGTVGMTGMITLWTEKEAEEADSIKRVEGASVESRVNTP